MTTRDLEAAFHRAMVDNYQRAKRELDYNATYFLQMLGEHGGVETARRLLTGSQYAEGSTRLVMENRLDLSVEALVLRPEFTPLFSDAERAEARRRLDEMGWKGQG